MVLKPKGMLKTAIILPHDEEYVMANAFRIVFSCWTKSLDLIGNLLITRGIRYARIDGSLTLSQRQKMLRDFEKEPSVSILIMTTGTGATGSVPYFSANFTSFP
jgi:SWI/SNF-related matrix-associated actin-dependent regulator of chromatin subfamily A3